MHIMIISAEVEVFTAQLVALPELKSSELKLVKWMTPEQGRHIEQQLDGQMLGDSKPYHSEHRLLVSPELFQTALEAMGYQIAVINDIQ